MSRKSKRIKSRLRAFERRMQLQNFKIYPHLLLKPDGKRCLKCKALLICTTQHVPRKVARCRRCNVRYGYFKTRIGEPLVPTELEGIERCPGRKAVVFVDCSACTG